MTQRPSVKKKGTTMTGRRQPPRERIILFCRYPVPGSVKTRLHPLLGPLGAAELHRDLSERVLSQARAVSEERGAGLDVCFTGGGRFSMERWMGRGPRYAAQEGRDLGERMKNAFQTAFHSGARRVILVGTDVPDLTAGVLHRALDSLFHAEIVLGPSRDGGYWLMGLNRPASLFAGIPWGTEAVLSRTVERAERSGLQVRLLDPLRDIDTPDDLRREGLEERYGCPYLSVIIPALNEEDRVGAAIRSSRSESAEVVVADGGSRDRTVERAQKAGARVVSGARGRAGQQNRGRSAAFGRVLLFLHADSLLP